MKISRRQDQQQNERQAKDPAPAGPFLLNQAKGKQDKVRNEKMTGPDGMTYREVAGQASIKIKKQENKPKRQRGKPVFTIKQEQANETNCVKQERIVKNVLAPFPDKVRAGTPA